MQELIDIAKLARSRAYARYSNYLVGAAILGDNGTIYSGCNVENISFGHTICAERVAASKMVSEGCQKIQSVAVVTEDGGTPCGACLQFLMEFSNDPSTVNVICVNEDGAQKEYLLSQLLPFGFRTELL